jgi:hypothetical protein
MALSMALGALAVTGCGGGGLSKSELARAANAICKRYNSQVQALQIPSSLAQSATAAAAFFDRLAPIFDAEVHRLQALKPADSARADWNAALEKFRRYTRLVDVLKTKADARDAGGVALLAQLGPVSAAANDAALSFGATDCASG